MRRTPWLLAVLVAVMATATSCTKDAATLTPSPAGSTSGAAAAGSLKATAPALLSPINGQKPAQGLELKITNSTTAFSANTVLTYRFEIYTTAGVRVYESPVVPAGAGTTSHSPNVSLTVDQTYQWQARAEYQGAAGPWTTPRGSFIAPQTGGYIRNNEIYDPLIDGKSVGTVVGPATFLPGVGIRMDSDTSYIEYALPQTLSAGEYSALITNLAVVSSNEDPKYRTLSMREGQAAINDNRFRMTLDKRGNGAPAYRFITGDANSGQYIEAGPGERSPLNFQRPIWYFWRAQWGGANFRFTILEDSSTGKLFYDISRPYKREYTPSPHMVYVGSPYVAGDRGEASTVKDMIVKQVWVSPNPRPAFANQ